VTHLDFIIISQSEVVDYSKYRELPPERLPIFRELIYPRMVHFRNGFRSHLDVINWLGTGSFWEDGTPAQRRDLLSIWNFPGFSGINLARYLRRFDIETLVINNIDAEWDIFREAYESSPRRPLVGLSTTFHLNFSEVSRVTRRLRADYPDISIILGGAFVHSLVQMNDTAELANAMTKYHVDFALHSFNPEVDLKELLLWHRRGDGKIESINNLAFRSKNAGGGVSFTQAIWNPPLLGLADATGVPPSLAVPTGTVQVRTSTGCPFSCEFCSYPELARGFHVMPPEVVEENLKNVLSAPGINKIVFIDDTFNVPVRRFEKLLRLFAKYDFEWFSFLRVQFVTDDIAALLKESGCRGVYLGIESANDTVLANMNKKVTCREYVEGIRALQKHDITTMAAFVLGFPGENAETVQDNVKFIEEMAFDFYTLKEFYYMENTPIHAVRDKYGLSGSGNRWSHATMESAEAYEHKISMFRAIKNSVFIDPDTSLWYLAYLYDQGFTMEEISVMQRSINALMKFQIEGDFADKTAEYESIRNIARKRFPNHA
jgi:p-methyltransferase